MTVPTIAFRFVSTRSLKNSSNCQTVKQQISFHLFCHPFNSQHGPIKGAVNINH